MDSFTSVTAPVSHRLELYTHHLLIQGVVTAPFKRTSDLLNSASSEFMTANNAFVTPLGQTPGGKPIDNPVMVRGKLLHFVVEMSEGGQPAKRGAQGAEHVGGREAFIRKDHYPCFALTGVYAIHGYCHLHPGTSLENLLRGNDVFFPITRPTIYLVANTKVSWRRDVVIINREMVTAMYLTSEPHTAASPPIVAR
jgi:hypothetical protein